MMTKSNYVPTTRSWAQFTAQIPSGSPTSTVFPYTLGDYALGTVSPSGEVGAVAHIGLQVADYWGVYRTKRNDEGSYTDNVIISATARGMHDMPDNWFNAVGSARLYLHDGTGSGIPATALAVYAVALKS